MHVKDPPQDAPDNNRVGSANDRADLAVEGQERDELGPGALPQPYSSETCSLGLPKRRMVRLSMVVMAGRTGAGDGEQRSPGTAR